MSTTLATAEVGHFFVPGAAGNRIHGLDFGGDGPALVCLHGVTGNAWNWYSVALGLRSHRRVVALDFRGYGESQWSPDHDYTTADHVAAVYDEVRFAGVDGGYHCTVYFMAACQHFGRAEVFFGSGVVMAVCDKDKV